MRNFHKSLQKTLMLCAIITLASCASRDPFTPKAGNSLYLCDDARQIIISLADKGERAAISFNGETMTLEREDDRIFSNSAYALYIHEEMAILEREGVPLLTGCRAG